MKKLLSAATSICMAASMLTTIPAVVNAADEDTTKGMSLRAVNMDTLESQGSDITVSADDLAKGDYTIHCGLYLEEQYATSSGILAKFGVSGSKCADGSAISVSRTVGETGATDPTAEWFTTAKEYTTKGGVTFSTKLMPTWTGTIFRKALSPNATNIGYDYVEDMSGYGIDDPCIVFNWISIKNDPWVGATSDEYPMSYFDVTLKQGAKEGKYYVDFQDVWENDQHTQRTNQIGSGVTTNLFFRTVDVNGSAPLTLKGLTITVGEGGEDPTPAPTPAPTTKPDPTSDPGSRLLGDTNCDGKVNVADVVILNKYCATSVDLMSDQGKINGEVTNPTTDLSKVDLTPKDSEYIIKSIVHLYELTEDGPVKTEYFGK